jgi:hypothetical protein
MKRFWTLTLTAILLLSACGPSSRNQSASTGTPGLLPVSSCGNGTCDGGESSTSCLQDCPTTAFSGHIATTTIKSDGSTGKIAVMIASPQAKRYPEGAGIVVVIPPIFSEADGFMRDPDLTSLGLIQVSYLWPGKADSKTGVKSGGTFDYGGENSTKVLRDVIRFAGGRIADINGRYIFGLTSVAPLSEEVGLYAFGDADIAGVTALSLYGDQLQGLQYYVGRENPTVDTISCMEIGYYDDGGQPVYNPFYLYPASYSFNALTLNYANLRWDSTYTSSHSKAAGRPYLDLDSNGSISTGDYVFDGQTPTMSGKRYYSTALTKALLDNGVLTLDGWPKDLATPQEAAQFWRIRQNPGQNPDRFADMQKDTLLQNLKVMLVFAQDDHAQVAQDKPHIHQAYQGFRFEARLWVRLNPDRVYVQSLMPGDRLDFPDNPANTQPDDWTKIGDYAYPGQGLAGQLVPLAAVAEMADRAHAGLWDENLGQVLYVYTAPTPQP